MKQAIRKAAKTKNKEFMAREKMKKEFDSSEEIVYLDREE